MDFSGFERFVTLGHSRFGGGGQASWTHIQSVQDPDVGNEGVTWRGQC